MCIFLFAFNPPFLCFYVHSWCVQFIYVHLFLVNMYNILLACAVVHYSVFTCTIFYWDVKCIYVKFYSPFAFFMYNLLLVCSMYRTYVHNFTVQFLLLCSPYQWTPFLCLHEHFFISVIKICLYNVHWTLNTFLWWLVTNINFGIISRRCTMMTGMVTYSFLRICFFSLSTWLIHIMYVYQTYV